MPAPSRGETISFLLGLSDSARPASFAMNPYLKAARGHIAGRGIPAEYARAQEPYLRSVSQMRPLALESFPELGSGFLGLLAMDYLHSPT